MAERVARLRRQDVRDALLGELASDSSSSLIGGRLIGRFDLMFPLGDPPDYEPDPSASVGGGAAARGPDAGRGRLRPDARRRRPWPAVPAGAQLRRRHARRRARPARPSGVRRRAVRRWRPRRHDLRRQLPDDAAAVVGPRSATRPAADRAARAQADAGDGGDGRPARPRPARPRSPGRHQRHRLRWPPPARARSSPTTCPPAASACCNGPTATSTRSSPAPRSAASGESTGATPGRLVRGAQSAS